MSLYETEINIFLIHHTGLSPHQIILLTVIGTTNPSQSIKAFCTQLYCGIALIMQAIEVIIKNVTITSVKSCFHIHFIIFSCSFLLGGFAPQWIFIQSFPNSGPCQNAPPKNERRVITAIATKLISIKKCLKIKHLHYIKSPEKEIFTKDIKRHLPRRGIQQKPSKTSLPFPRKRHEEPPF